MRPFDEIPFEESDYSDVALLVAGVREWPSEDFTRELDALVARRFEPETAPASAAGRGGRRRSGRGRIAAGLGGGGFVLVAGAVAAVLVLSGGGGGATGLADHASYNAPGSVSAKDTTKSERSAGAVHAAPPATHYGAATNAPTPTLDSLTPSNGTAGTAQREKPAGTQSQSSASALSPPVAPGGKQIRSAQISLTTPNQHVNQVASEVYTVVGAEHGNVLSSRVTSATTNSGGGYATFSLSIPTSNLQDAMTQLSTLHYAALKSSSNVSQNVSNQYNSDQRQLADAKALRTSLLKQLETAYTQSAIDSIKAQLQIAEREINTWQATLGSLQHRISYSNVTVQINEGGLPIPPVVKHSHSFTIGRAGHDALRVLVVSAGVALIALAVAIPIGLVVALLMWLWVWLRQRRREHALDATS